MRVFLCEKPSQGKDIARVLGAAARGQGCYTGQGIVVTWCIGHLLETASPEHYGERYKRWSLDQLPIIPARWHNIVKTPTAAQFKIVERLLKDATELVIATDADREGEMIAREIIEQCGFSGPIKRLWLSALNDASIRKALTTLKSDAETRPLYHAALARSRADWLVGMNLSRLFTLLGQQAGYSGTLSVGRVQTPTLRLVVVRDREIAHFVSVPYWVIGVELSQSGTAFTATWQPPEGATDEAGHCLRKELAQQAFDVLRTSRSATAQSVETSRVREAAPLPFDLGTLQTVCSRQLGFDVQETLDIAQSLYETHKATTYPRTDTGYLPENMLPEVPTVLKALLATDPGLHPLLQRLDPGLRSRAWDDSKISAHHGIIPTLEAVRLSAFSDKERAVYTLIRGRYLAQFLPHHEFDRTVAQFICSGHALTATGKRIVVPGWHLAIAAHAQESEAAQALPPLAKGDASNILGAQLKPLKTLPPKPYTQGELIAAMKGIARFVTDPRLKQKLKETTGIGTEATRAGIIEALFKRQYLAKDGRALRASGAAHTLIDAVPAAIADPGTTALWEQALDQIAAGQMTLDDFVTRQSNWVAQLVQTYRGAHLTIKSDYPSGGPQKKTVKRPSRRRPGS